jgi:nucleoid-associated protein YgaU
MSKSGWTTAAAEPSSAGPGAEVRPLNHHHNSPGGHGQGQDEAPLPPGEGPASAHDPQDDTESSGKRFGAWLRPRISREARIGAAALLSFVILVSALVVKKSRTPTASGKQPPLAKIASPGASTPASTSTSTTTAQAEPRSSPGSASEHPEQSAGRERLPSESTPPLLPAAPALAGAVPPPAEPQAPGHDPSLKVPEPAAEPAQFAAVPGHEPVLPAAAGPAQAAGSLTLPAPDLPPAASTSVAAGEMPAAQPAPVPLMPLAPAAEPRTTSRRAAPTAPEGAPPPPVTASANATPTPVAEPLPGAIETPTRESSDPGVALTPFNPPPASPAGGTDTDPAPTRAPQLPRGKPSRTRASDLPRTASGPESLEPPGQRPPTANPFADPSAAGQGGWVALPNGAVRQSSLEEPRVRPGAGQRQGQGQPGGLAQTGAARLDPGDLAESVPHLVARGENFFSIAQHYYGSGRFYPALWKANSDQVPAPEKLVVGQTIRIPPPEALDRSLILAPRTAPGSGTEAAAAPPSSRSSAPRSSVVALTVPAADPFDDGSRQAVKPAPGAMTAAPSAAERPRLPRYKIHPQETLRSIARDLLGDSRRADEILELNREVIDDPGQLTPGQEIELPEDARITRRARAEP